MTLLGADFENYVPFWVTRKQAQRLYLYGFAQITQADTYNIIYIRLFPTSFSTKKAQGFCPALFTNITL